MKQTAYPSYFAEGHGVPLHYILVGPDTGKTVFLLHGFPEFWYGWRNQIDALAAAGFRVVVPDQRGYNLSGKPHSVRKYDIDLLAADMVALMDHLGCDQVYLAGHDWGAAVAWWLAIRYPERVRRLAVLNVPHPHVMVQNVLRNPVQRRKSWYIFFFQLPVLPELLLRANGHKNAVRMLRGSGLPGSFLQEDIVTYQEAWSQPRAWNGMVNWYRAFMRRRKRIPAVELEMPVLIIWGEQDVALEASMAAESLTLCRDGLLKTVPEATHWVQHDAAEKVSAWLVGFFGDNSTSLV